MATTTPPFKSILLPFVIMFCSMTLTSQEHSNGYIGIRLAGNDFSGTTRHDLDDTEIKFDKRTNIEILGARRISQGLLIRVSVGYTQVEEKRLYVNYDYRHSGVYTRIGIVADSELDTRFALHPGLALYYAKFAERGTYTLTGQSFGDLTGQVRRGLHAFSLEPHLDLRLRLMQRLALQTSFKYNWLLTRSKPDSHPVIHIPGRGMKDVGLDLSLVYQF
ncbi:MAG: DUF6048 family protein [Saprospiraceae bacterium]|nr:DUF6048 family protein [Saprospiraceae bacterium]